MPSKAKLQLALPIETEFGPFMAHYTDSGLAQLDFPRPTPFALAPDVPLQIRRWHKLTSRALLNVLAGKPSKALPPLDLAGSDFQKRVWTAVQQIKKGRTITYRELAEIIGKAKAVRAVGSACGANPVPVLIPCHRVVASNGTMCGFSGGIEWKWRLLGVEQASISGVKFLPKMFKPSRKPSLQT